VAPRRRGLPLRRGGASLRRRTGVRKTGRRALHRRRTETGARAFACERARCTRAPRSDVSACRVRARALAQRTRLTGYRAAADSAGCAALLGYSPSPRGAQRPARSRHTAGTQNTHAHALRAQAPSATAARLERRAAVPWTLRRWHAACEPLRARARAALAVVPMTCMKLPRCFSRVVPLLHPLESDGS
jgi:hypothetical protein